MYILIVKITVIISIFLFFIRVLQKTCSFFLTNATEKRQSTKLRRTRVPFYVCIYLTDITVYVSLEHVDNLCSISANYWCRKHQAGYTRTISIYTRSIPRHGASSWAQKVDVRARNKCRTTYIQVLYTPCGSLTHIHTYTHPASLV